MYARRTTPYRRAYTGYKYRSRFARRPFGRKYTPRYRSKYNRPYYARYRPGGGVAPFRRYSAPTRIYQQQQQQPTEQKININPPPQSTTNTTIVEPPKSAWKSPTELAVYEEPKPKSVGIWNRANKTWTPITEWGWNTDLNLHEWAMDNPEQAAPLIKMGYHLGKEGARYVGTLNRTKETTNTNLLPLQVPRDTISTKKSEGAALTPREHRSTGSSDAGVASMALRHSHSLRGQSKVCAFATGSSSQTSPRQNQPQAQEHHLPSNHTTSISIQVSRIHSHGYQQSQTASRLTNSMD